jgi:hypothetical protein
MSEQPAPVRSWHAVVRPGGVDMLRWNGEGKLVSFTVMVRPMRGLQKLVELMARQLAVGQA